MTTVDFNNKTLLELADYRHQHAISIYLPTHRKGHEVQEGKDKIAYKNHLQTVRLSLEAQSLRSNDLDDLMRPLELLYDDDQFWRHQQEGLAVFRSPDYFAVYKSPLPLEDSVQFDDRFRIRPLLAFVESLQPYYLLVIDKKEPRLYWADLFNITPVDMDGTMPDGLEAVTQYYDFEEQLQGRTKGRGGMTAMYTSDDSNEKEKEKAHLLADYFRLIDGAVTARIGTQNEPLLLASVEFYQPIYRSVNTYPHLYPAGLTGNFEHVQVDDLHQMANEQLSDAFAQRRNKRIEQYQNNSGNELVSRDARKLLEAAVTGQIDVLFMEANGEIWGQFDEQLLTAIIRDEPQPGDRSLIDEVALLTLRYGGEVYVLNDMHLLEQQEPVMMTALLRF